MNEEFILALNQLESEKGIKKDIVFEALEAALISSYKKNFGMSNQNIVVDINKENGNIKIFKEMTVVDEVEDEDTEISLEDAEEISSKYKVGNIVRIEIDPMKFGRIAAQTAKQVVIQKIKDAEKDIIYDDFIDREGELITGQVQRSSKGYVFIDLGKSEGILPPNEQIKGEDYSHGNRYKMIILEVKKTPKGPQIILSRSHPNLIKRLFELEVPEIHDGIVEVFNISREAGSRTKIAVFSKSEDVDPLGACVGFKGARVKAILDSIGEEKIDIIIWDRDIDHFIANALSPSNVEKVFIDDSNKQALVVVPDYQLSLAIGKEGQNVRLAAKLTNWKIDIKSVSQFEEYLEAENMTEDELYAKLGYEDDEDENVADEEIEFHDEASAEDIDEEDEMDLEEAEDNLDTTDTDSEE
ncbi:MAG: transcription termination factor NusA [Peptoniphilus duerdenii]|uniref:transcription termination factor NusA n=1 Tax=Peptoniphilus duerdenii TaxID=507750 RepID=UPI002551BF3B|nr:transcription termination factor NusA [Peptoniphilus duerdenii]MDK8276476.1 transcription termination factor NusA [Peptoniphilus duerdenii]